MKNLSGAMLQRTIPVSQMKLWWDLCLEIMAATQSSQRAQSIVDDLVNAQGLTEVPVRWRGDGS